MIRTPWPSHLVRVGACSRPAICSLRLARGSPRACSTGGGLPPQGNPEPKMIQPTTVLQKGIGGHHRRAASRTAASPEALLAQLQKFNRARNFEGAAELCREQAASGCPVSFAFYMETLRFFLGLGRHHKNSMVTERLLELSYSLLLEAAPRFPAAFTNDTFRPVLKLLDVTRPSWVSIQNFDTFLERLDGLLPPGTARLDCYVVLKHALLLFYKHTQQYEQAAELLEDLSESLVLPLCLSDMLNQALSKGDFVRVVLILRLAQTLRVSLSRSLWRALWDAALWAFDGPAVRYIFEQHVARGILGVVEASSLSRALEVFSRNHDSDTTLDVVEHFSLGLKLFEDDAALAPSTVRCIIDSYCVQGFRFEDVWPIVETFVVAENSPVLGTLQAADLDHLVRSYRLFSLEARERHSLQTIEDLVSTTHHPAAHSLFVLVVLRILHLSVNLSGFLHGYALLGAPPAHLALLCHKIGTSNAGKLTSYLVFKHCLEKNHCITAPMYVSLIRSQMCGSPNWRLISMYLYEYVVLFGCWDQDMREVVKTLHTLGDARFARLVENLTTLPLMEVKDAFMEAGLFYTRNSVVLTNDMDPADHKMVHLHKLTDTAFVSDFIPKQYRSSSPVSVFGKSYHYDYDVANARQLRQVWELEAANALDASGA